MEGLHAKWNLTALVSTAELACVFEVRVENNALSFSLSLFCFLMKATFVALPTLQAST